jgi:putative aldouronate transport system substrate-binding protein
MLKLMGMSAASAVLAACGGQTVAPMPTAAPAAPTAAPAAPTAAPAIEPTAAPTTAPTAAPAPAVAPANGISLAFDKYPDGWTTNILPSSYKASSTLEISMAIKEDPNVTYLEGDDPVNTPANRLTRDALGIFPKAAFTYTTDYDTKMLAAMADQSLPDVFFLNPALYGRFLQAGALEDITDIWNSTASAKLKEYAAAYDGRIIRSAMVNGRMMGVPGGAKFEAQDNMLVYYRKDIFDRLGLAAPDTIETFEAALRATQQEFASDPAWVGLPGNRTMITWINSFDIFFGPTGAIPSIGRTDIRIWVKGQDGKLIYGSVDERIKPVLEMLATWYKDGLIDREFYTRDESKSTEPIAAGKTAMFVAPSWGIGWPGGLTAQNVPEAEWAVTLPPTDRNGKRGWLETNPTYGYINGFRKGVEPEKVEAIIQHLNWALENSIAWRENNLYGFDGYDWTYDAENAAYVIKNNRPGAYLKSFLADSNTWGGYNLKNSTDFVNYGLELAKGGGAGLNGWQQALATQFSDPKPGEKDTVPLVSSVAGQGIYTEYYGPPTSTMAARGAQLDKLEQETFTAIITGSKPLSAFDEFITQWKRLGGDAITNEVNRWYETGESA